jgi:2-phospho-L-lactate guanylyltransferase
LAGPAALAEAIALDSVEAALGAARVIVVTTVAAAADFEALGAVVVTDPGGGLNAAVVAGISAAGAGAVGESPAGDTAVAVLLGDLPALASAELAAALAAAGRHPLAFVADADSTGTTLITALRGTPHSPAFGPGSRAAHLAAGYVELEFPADSGLRRDVDTADQLAVLDGRLGPRTAALAG